MNRLSYLFQVPLILVVSFTIIQRYRRKHHQISRLKLGLPLILTVTRVGSGKDHLQALPLQSLTIASLVSATGYWGLRSWAKHYGIPRSSGPALLWR